VPIVWRRQAVDDLRALQAYIGKDDPRAAARIARRVRSAVEILAAQPRMGRVGRVKGTRELIVAGTPYIVPYRLRANEVQILRVYHAARRWPKRL
jgi:addiction module RelE/StbE family toxin